MAAITIKDVLKKAIEMEEAGKIFYEYAAGIIDNEDLRKIMSVLASEEVGHKHIFENMMHNVENINFSNEKNEYLQYLENYLTTKSVFDRKKFESKKDDITNILEALDFAMDREQDSILYYMTLMTIVREEQSHLVQKIIEEERKHFIKLNKTKDLIKK